VIRGKSLLRSIVKLVLSAARGTYASGWRDSATQTPRQSEEVATDFRVRIITLRNTPVIGA
jgi:hypothetical protein